MTVALLLETVTLLTAISGPTRKKCWPGKLPRLMALAFVTAPRFSWQTGTAGLLLPIGPRIWFDRYVWSPLPVIYAQMAIAPVGLPIAPSGMASSTPDLTCAAATDSSAPVLLVLHPLPPPGPPSTPFVLLLLMVPKMK